jgi:hypothetical protein
MLQVQSPLGRIVNTQMLALLTYLLHGNAADAFEHHLGIVQAPVRRTWFKVSVFRV